MLLCSAAVADDGDSDGIPDVVEQKIGTPVDTLQSLEEVAVSPRRGFSDEEATQHAPDIVDFSACHVGDQRLLLKVTFAQRPEFAGATFIIYADMDNDDSTGRVDEHHGGVDVMVSVHGDKLATSLHDPSFTAENTIACGTIHNDSLYVSLDAPLRIRDGHVELGLHLLSQRSGGTSDGTRHSVVKLPLLDRPAPKLPQLRSDNLRSLDEYRYYDDKVQYEKLSDKGLTYQQVARKQPIQFGRPRPPVPFSTSRKPGQPGAIGRQRVKVNVLEEAGVTRRGTPITFGLPIPQGGLYDLANLRLLSRDNQEIPAQFTATVFWPDDSLKWVLVDFQADLDAKQDADCIVEFGTEVTRKPVTSKLQVDESADHIRVHTGPLEVVIDKQRFNIFRSVNVAGQPTVASASSGVRLIDEHGELYSQSAIAPRRIAIEEIGPQKVVIRAEGDYSNDTGQKYMGYITRLVFRAGSPRVTVAHTHVNTFVKTEFTDITSLVFPLTCAGGVKQAVTFARDDDGLLQERAANVAEFQVAQWNEKEFTLGRDEADLHVGQYPGLVRLDGANGPTTVAVHEFWQHWPKAFDGDKASFAIHLLPQQPSSEFGRDLPFWLMYPFVEGKYRFKWGMSFTTRVTFDFAGKTAVNQLLADADMPVVAVLPARWYASSKALGNVSVPKEQQFALWDAYVADAYQQHMRRKAASREYGYLNFGDWFGERGRNWGNNEYDLAHGFFMQFVRTGIRDYFRLALSAARHQANVDCVHAYPDPHYVGANHQHSIGHTGTWSQVPMRATWSHPYDSHTDARNGHTWADGMMDAWYLAGEARVMEASIGLGEHITWAMSRTFERLGTHERSAGWSLAAILAIYRGTYDPAYLAAARRIVAIPLREQKFDDGGAWPHVLPRDHSGGRHGARGNNLFLIGVLLAGLKNYHEATGDPAVEKSLISGARWALKSWNEEAKGWPYSASTSGEPYYEKVSPSLNMLIIDSLAYAGKLTGEQEFLDVTEKAFAAVASSKAPSDGKSVAQRMFFATDIMALLQQWFAEHRDDEGSGVLDGN